MTTRRATAVRRVVAAVLSVVAVAAGLFVHGALPDTAATDIAGDALYVVVVWGLVVLLAPRLPAAAVAGIVLVWCIAVELFQLTGLPEEFADDDPDDPPNLLEEGAPSPLQAAVEGKVPPQDEPSGRTSARLCRATPSRCAGTCSAALRWTAT